MLDGQFVAGPPVLPPMSSSLASTERGVINLIFYWLTRLWLRFRWLFTPPADRDVARIDANAPCPACGARDGELMCTTPIVRHTCHQCGARWHEPMVIKTDSSHVWPSAKYEQELLLPRSGRAA